jgi:hypothetical protein
MRLVTVATHSDRYFPFLLESCRRHGAHLDVLGWGMKWVGFMMKFGLMIEYLRALERDEVVCVVDAYDVILLKPLAVLEQRFRATRSGIAISRSCPPSTSPFGYMYGMMGKFGFGNCRGNLLNAGTYVGFAGPLYDLFVGVCSAYDCSDGRLDDQVIMTEYCNRASGQDVHIDEASAMFYVCEFSDFAMPDTCVLHGPGNRDLGPFLTQEGYVGGDLVDRKVVEYCTSFAKHWVGQPRVAAALFIMAIMAIAVVVVVRMLPRKKRR